MYTHAHVILVRISPSVSKHIVIADSSRQPISKPPPTTPPPCNSRHHSVPTLAIPCLSEAAAATLGSMHLTGAPLVHPLWLLSAATGCNTGHTALHPTTQASAPPPLERPPHTLPLQQSVSSGRVFTSVSYTHLTLPTICSV